MTEPCRGPIPIPWGIDGLDGPGRGLVAGAFNMIAMPDHDSANAITAHFLSAELRGGGRACLVSFDNPSLTLPPLEAFGFDFDQALRSEQLVYLYYKPPFLHSLSLATDYNAVFTEIRHLAGPIQRLALLNAELFFTLQSEHLTFASVSSATAAARQSGFSILGCWVPQRTEGHRSLRAACRNLMPLYVTGTRLPGSGRQYRLRTSGCVGGKRDSVTLNLDIVHEHRRLINRAETA